MAISREYLEEVLQMAKKTLPGWAYAVIHSQARAVAGGRVSHRADSPSALERFALERVTSKELGAMCDSEIKDIWERVSRWHKGATKKKSETRALFDTGKAVLGELRGRKIKAASSSLLSAIEEFEKTFLEPIGPKRAKVAFVGTSTGMEEVEGKSLVTGADRDVFIQKYLTPLGLTEEEIFQLSIIPVAQEGDASPTVEGLEKWLPWAQEELDNAEARVVVALGKSAKIALGEYADFVLPHPKALIRHKDSGEVGRKIRQILKKLDNAPDGGENTINSPAPSEGCKGQISDAEEISGSDNKDQREMEAQILKSDSSKRIVYGVVMDPYGAHGMQPDAHKDFLSPSMIEETAHEFMQGDRVIGRQHQTKAHSRVVESWIESYPTPAEYQKALRGENHKVSRRKFGSDVLHSGSWVLGVKLGDVDWTSYERGDFNAFSPGGIGMRVPVEPQEMPKIDFVDLVETTDAD